MEERLKELEFDFKNLVDFLDNQTIEMRESNKILGEITTRNDETITNIFNVLKTLTDKILVLENEIQSLKK